MVHAFDHAAIDGILPVQEVVIGKVDEELAVGAVRVLAAGRAQRAAIMGNATELCWQVRQAGAAGTRAAQVEIVFHVAVLHIAGLGHEPVDHAVKGDVVIFPCPGKFFHAGTMLGRDIGQKLDRNGSVLQLDQDGVLGVFVVCHRGLLGSWSRRTLVERHQKEKPSRLREGLHPLRRRIAAVGKKDQTKKTSSI